MANDILNGSKINWSLVIQLVSIFFLAGIAYASFETKENARVTAEEARKFNAQTYMPRELSLEKWRNNDISHEKIQNMLEDLSKALRESNRIAARNK